MNDVKRYMNAIERRLRVNAKTRVRIMRDLAADFQNRRDAGQTDTQIMAELGTPESVAAEFNASFGKVVQAPSPWRWLFLAGMVVTGLVMLLLLRWWPAYSTESGVDVIGGADGPTAIFVTTGAGMDPDIILMAGGALLLALAAGFLLLGWCRGGAHRIWLPILLCALPLAGTVLWAVILLAEMLWVGAAWGIIGKVMAGLFDGALLLALAADIAVLVWAVRTLQDKNR